MIVQELNPVRPRAGAQRPTAVHPAPLAGTPPSSRRSWKKIWLRLHLYVGLIGGGLFVLTSLTGSLLVFYKTIDEWLNPEQVIRTVGTDRPLSDIVAGARTAHPDWSPPD